MPDTSLISIIIVNYNSAGFLKSCLESIFRSDVSTKYEVIVVDNASTPDPLYKLLKSEQKRARFLEISINRGYAAGCNAGIREAHGNIVMLLNPDIVLEPDTIQKLYERITRDPKTGIVGPKIFYPDRELQSRFLPKTAPTLKKIFFEMFYIDKIGLFGSRCDSFYMHHDRELTRDLSLEQVSGACLMMKTKMLAEIGLMDENYFLYYEETDLCRRAKDRGYDIVFVSGASIIHHEGGSSLSRRSIKNFFQSQYYYFRKHHSIGSAALLYLINTAGLIFRTVLLAVPAGQRSPAAAARNIGSLKYHLNPLNFKKAISR